MSDPRGGRELSRFLATVRGPRRMSQEAVEVTARDFADTVTASREDRELLTGILIRGTQRETGAKPPAVALLEEALFLRMNGEYAPGGNENWHDWDSKAETFLRGLPPPEAGESSP